MCVDRAATGDREKINMKISIALPSFNYAPFLEECLQSIAMQDYHDYEVLIADGGSTDASHEIINRFCGLDERFRLVSIGDDGQSDAIMKAFSSAKGDIFCFLNADDCFICVDALSAVVSAFVNYPRSDIVSFTGYYINAESKYLKPVKLRYHPLDNIDFMRYRTAVLQPATFWKRAVHEKVPMSRDSHYTFDAIFFYQAYINFSWLESSKPVAGHRLHGSNKSLRINFERIRELAKFEKFKFGSWSLRALYLNVISVLVWVFCRLPIVGPYVIRMMYLCVNSIAYITCYRMPSI